MPKLFKRTKENFVCAVCNTEVTGNGYTNHCPDCLWSLHCDINPGDRASNCLGLMRPVLAEKRNGEIYLRQRCETCGHERNNKLADNDNFSAMLNIMRGSQG